MKERAAVRPQLVVTGALEAFQAWLFKGVAASRPAGVDRHADDPGRPRPSSGFTCVTGEHSVRPRFTSTAHLVSPRRTVRDRLPGTARAPHTHALTDFRSNFWYVAINEFPDVQKFDLKSVKACVSGAAPLPQAVAKRFAEVSDGAVLVEGYGLTECSPVTHVNPLDGRGRPGSIGMPIPDTDVRIISLDDPDKEMPQGEPGELCIKGPQVMLGYWRRPEETALAIRNGWFHTGDVAVMEPDGFFRIVDRLKDMVLVSGFNVYPNEVEDVLYHHPAISKCAVIGVPDDRTGERVKAFVVLKEGRQLTAEELMAWCKDPAQGLTGYRAPKEVEFRDALPETLVGKVLRRVLVDEERSKREAATAAP